MFKCDYKKLKLSFNEFHGMERDDLPEYGEFCLIELKDGSHTAGKWSPDDYDETEPISGKFVRGTGDFIDYKEVVTWHSLSRYDLSNCLAEEDIGCINLGVPKEDSYSIKIGGFVSINDGDYPKEEQYCLLIRTDGCLAAGRWDEWWDESGGSFIYAPALASYSMEEVWAWAPLSVDEYFAAELELEKEREHEAELNRNPETDPEKFKYGTDIAVYYRKALSKLKKKYPWAKMAQMKKDKVWEIVPLHGKYVFAYVDRAFNRDGDIEEWTGGSTSDDFIDFLCEYNGKTVKNSNPKEKFKYGPDIEVYLKKALEEVKKDYCWLDRETADQYCRFAIKKVNGEPEYVCAYGDSKKLHVCEYYSADEFIKHVVREYQNAALRSNPVVAEYKVPFGRIEIHGWGLEHYIFSKLKTGDYKVDVQAGDRTTGGSREFFVTRYCFEAKTYEEFLDRYLQIVPGHSFGLGKEDLIKDKKLKSFLGY